MRIAVGDPGSALIKRVYVNGVRRIDVLEVDTVEGWADVIVLGPDGDLKVIDGELVKRRVRGSVEIMGVVPR